MRWRGSMSIIKNNRYLFFLFLIAFLVCATNYTFGTWLTGWDNLHAEFDIPMNIYRSIFAVWQEYQGLGLLGGMAHASDLPRQLFLLIFSFVLPASFLRYFFMFVMLFVGTAGMYKIAKDIFLANYHSEIKEKGAFLAGIFYLLNIGTVQYFFVPFEPYSAFWGFFPWEIFGAIRFLQNPTRRNLLFLAIINILAIPQAYVQTIFLVYAICLTILMGTFLFQHRSKMALWICTKIVLAIFCVNAFWLLPNLYFTVTNVSTTQFSMMNKVNNDRAFAMNKSRGTIKDFPLLRGFYYDFLTFNPLTNKYEYMMQEWKKHYETVLPVVIGYIFFAIVLLGLVKKNPYRPFLVGLFLLSGIALLSDTIIISLVNDLLRALPIINQIFRNPFTKFIVPAIFLFSICFALGMAILLQFAQRRNNHAPIIIVLVIVLLSGWQAFPTFQGEFLSKGVRVAIPQEYFKLFSYFKKQDKNARIMNLPQGSYWGWGSYSWGLTGSGFLWYGIKQPILDRAFDVWSKPLEGYYWELWYALKKKDQKLFNQIIDKYHVSYIIYDTNYTPSDSNPFKALYNQQSLLTNNNHVVLAKKIGSILVYKTRTVPAAKNNLLLAKNLGIVKNHEQFSNEDTAFAKLGPYIESKEPKENTYATPFGSLFTNRFPEENSVDISQNKDAITFSKSIPKGKYTLSYPNMSSSEPLVPVDILAKRDGNTIQFRFLGVNPTISLNGTPLKSDPIIEDISVDIQGQPANASFLLGINSKDFLSLTPQQDFTYVGSTYFINAQGANTLRLYAKHDAKSASLPPQKFTLQKECETTKNQKSILGYAIEDRLMLEAKNTSLCSVYQDVLPVNKDISLIKVSFSYTSTTDEFPDYCLATPQSHGCMNTKKHFASYSGFSNTKRDFSDFVEITAPITDSSFQLILDATSPQDAGQIKQIAYRNIQLTTYPYITSISGDIGSKQKSLAPTTVLLDLPSESVISVSMPKRKNSFDFPNLLNANVYKKTALPATELPITGDFYAQELPDQTNKSIRVYARNTYSQLWLTPLKVEANLGYVLGLKTRNISGFPFTINAFTPSENNKYVYTQLPKQKDYTQTYYVLPPLYEFDKGLQILLMSSSFNRIPTVNDVSDISLSPIPYGFLTTIALYPTGSMPISHLEQPKKASKENLSGYHLPYPDTKQNDTVILSQSHDDGWKAYETNNFLAKMFPFLFGKELKNHVLVNNWANGWKLDAPATDGSEVTIIYLPQYLEFIGFLLLPIVFSILMFPSRFSFLTSRMHGKLKKEEPAL